MAIQYINVVVGQKLPDGTYHADHAGNSASQAGHVSVAFDTAVIANRNQLKAALDLALSRADQAGLAKA